MSDAVMRAQAYAVDMELDMRKVFGCDRLGFAGVVDSDFIRSEPLAAVLATCGFLYANVSEKNKILIEKFVKETIFLWQMSLDELLSFETSSRTTGYIETEIGYDNGEKAVKDIISKFSDICKLVD